MLAGIKFLVVDDHPYIREIIATILKAVGADSVIFASGGGQGLAMIRRGAPDIVILDDIMEDMDGLEVVRQVRQNPDSPFPFVPIIMVTARAERTFVIRARDMGVTEFVSKPISAARLLQRIGLVLTAPRLFIKSAAYTGPDRRRRKDPAYTGPLRRAADGVLDL